MKLGLIADSHDNLTKLAKAIKLFNREKLDLVFHAGDFIAPFTLDLFAKLNCEYLGVFGNNDGEREGLSNKSEGRIKADPLKLNKANRKILLIHDISNLDSKNKNYDLVVYGHSHKKEASLRDSTLFINPGECGGWLTGKSSVAIIDLLKMKVKFFKL